MKDGSSFIDYFEILSISSSANTAQIRAAYRRLARKTHPDVSKNQSESREFLLIREAYEVLKDPSLREQYRLQWKREQVANATINRRKKIRRRRIECQVVFYRNTSSEMSRVKAFEGFDQAFLDLERTWTKPDQDLTRSEPLYLVDTGENQDELDSLITNLYIKRQNNREIDGWEYQGDLVIKSLRELGDNLQLCLMRIRRLLHDLPEHSDGYRTGYAIYSIDEKFEIWNQDSLSEYARMMKTLEELYGAKAEVQEQIEGKISRLDTVLQIRRLAEKGCRGVEISRALFGEVKPREVESIFKVLGSR
ncbi:J domain-containing protein [bacterium]|jgi:curved DNA-binding protein CbpA|nr:J domain-containing protein [bacterium]